MAEHPKAEAKTPKAPSPPKYPKIPPKGRPDYVERG